ncbi:MAG TPA: glycosyltransferase family 2 protein [Vitreimonas sp.]|jgi:succinoglycan biosynthesis protein ExoU|nr:glycosyltransferase family 2 protein [Vitreimonas sp.]
MSAGEKIAVVIAAYNAEPTLDRAIASALAQPETGEVCVVDDASADGTAALVQSWTERDPRVSLIRQSLNQGPSAARNAAIAATHCPWIAILDADDYLAPGRFAALMSKGAEADLIADALIRVFEGQAPPALTEAFAPQALSFEAFVIGNLGAQTGALDLGFLKPVFRRAFWDAHALSYRTDMRLGEDYELYARALLLGARFLVGGATGYISVEREGSLSKAHSEADLEKLRDCDAGLRAVRALSASEDRALRRRWTSMDCRLQWRRLISAVKTRDFRAALTTFHTPDAAVYLAARLGEQVWERSAAALRRA